MSKVKKRAVSIAAAFMLMLTMFLFVMPAEKVSAWDGSVADAFAGGSGTASDPYLIATAEQLALMAQNANAEKSLNHSLCYKLTANIDLSGHNWTPIGGDENKKVYFKGTFDGDYHTITGLTVNTDDFNNAFIQSISLGGTVKRLGLVNVNINGESFIGGICSKNNGIVSECYVTGKIQSRQGAGGICYSVGQYGLLENCYSAADVTETTLNGGAGGICGHSDGTVRNCYSTGTIKGVYSIGGICGSKEKYGNPSADNCYSIAKLICGAEDGIGGICGRNYDGSGTFTNCYYNTDVINVNNGYGTAITTPELCSGSLPNGFDSSIWTAGSAETVLSGDGITGTQKFHLPYLTFLDNFDRNSSGFKQSELTVTVYKNGNDWISCTPIYTAQQLQDINKNLSGAYVLMNDIDVSSLPSTSEGNWTAIGTENDPFTGLFDGNGHTVSGIKINKPNDPGGQGLFGDIEGAVIKNVGVIDSDIKGRSGAGGVCGSAGVNSYGTVTAIENCYFSGRVSGNDAIGGICGLGYVKIISCYNLGEVSGHNSGGICGLISNGGSISNCYNTGKISAASGRAGGICGQSLRVNIDNCYNNGEISAVNDQAGGICAYSSSVGYTVQNCYNTGKISVTVTDDYEYPSDCFAGGICGFTSGSVENSYNIGEVSETGGAAIGGVCGNGNAVNSYYNSDIVKTDNGIGTGKTTLEMTSSDYAVLLGSEWTNKDNIKSSNGGTAFYPALTVFEDKAPSVKYTSKLGISFKNDKSGFIVSALVKFDGMSIFKADDPALTSGKGTYSIRANGSEIANGDIFDNTEITVDHAIIPAEKCVYTLVYDGTDSYFFPMGSSTAEMHNYGAEWLFDETEHWHICIDCGRSGENEAHIYDEGIVTIEPTEETEGEKLFTCTVCGQQKTGPIAPLSHTHIMNRGYSSDAAGHWLTCAKCDEKIDFASHISDNGTIMSTGEKIYKCTVCGYVVKTETVTITENRPTHFEDLTISDIFGMTVNQFKDKLNVQYETDGSTLTISWDEIDRAGKYIVYQQIDGKYKPIKYTTDTSVTLKNLKNGQTYRFIVKYTMNGFVSPLKYSEKLTVKMYYKPIVTAEADKNSIILTWNPVPNAEKYAVYKYENGKAAKLSETEKTIVKLTGLKPDTEYSCIVSMYADGKWSALTKGDIVTARTLA